MLERAPSREAGTRGAVRPPLRVGFLVADRTGFETWQLRAFDRIQGDARFEIAAMLVHPRPFGNQSEPGFFGLVSRIERKVLAREPAYRPATFDPADQRFEMLAAGNGQGGVDAPFAQKLIESLDLDLVIRMTAEGLPDGVIKSLPFGEWGFSFSRQRSRTADWSGYTDMLAGDPSVEMNLDVRRSGDAANIRMADAHFNVKFSGARNDGFVKERAVTLLMRELGRLADTGVVDGVPAEPAPQVPPPATVDLIRYSFSLASRITGRAKKLFQTKTGTVTTIWTLFSGQGNIADFEPSQSTEWPSTSEEIRADPFLIEHDGQSYCFYEAYSSKVKKAHIAVSRIEPDGLKPLGIALIRDYHLSYPFVFHHEGQLYMMPETNQARRIEIWRCVAFPLKWELHATALEGKSPADSMLHRIGDRWWLFTNLSDFHAYEDHCSELHIFEVDGPDLKMVTPHALNPVVIDSTTARNAGRLFEIDGRLYRPAQRNEYGIYGYGLNIMEITSLGLDVYEEKLLRVIRPDFKPGLMGCHHFDASNGRYVIDARLSE